MKTMQNIVSFIFLYLGIAVGRLLRPYRLLIIKKRNEKSLNKKSFINKSVRSLAYNFFSTLRLFFLFLASIPQKIYHFLLIIINALKKQIAILKWKRINFENRLLAYEPIYLFYIAAKTYSRTDTTVIRRTICTARTYCEKKKSKYFIMEMNTEREVYIPPFYERCEGKALKVLTPEIYVCEMPNVDVYGGCSALFSEEYCIYDALVRDKENRLDIRFSNMLCKLGNSIFLVDKSGRETYDKVICMVGFASYNYYHLTLEILSRLRYVDTFMEYRDLPILVDSIVFKIPQFTELFNTINTYKHPIFKLSEGEAAHVNTLIYPSYNTWMPINVKKRNLIRPGDFAIAESAVKNVRNVALKNIDKFDYSRIFLTRKHTTTTRLTNEKEIADLFSNYGFKILATEDFSYYEQVALFHGAKCIVGTSGAALTNIIYCKPDTLIVCIIPEMHQFYMYSTVAHLLNCHVMFLDANIQNKTPFPASDSFNLDYGYCKRFLNDYFGRKDNKKLEYPTIE